MAVVIGVALLKPWSEAPAESPPAVAFGEPAPIDGKTPSTPDPHADPTRSTQHPQAPAFPAPSSVAGQTPAPISLVDVRTRGFPHEVRYDVFSAVLATATDTYRVRFRDEMPRLPDIGYCDTGALIDEPVEELALATAMVPVTSYELYRVFASGDPVAV